MNVGGAAGRAPDLPKDILQQVGVPASSKCSDILDTSINWAGVSSGGWGVSWAQWINVGKGGAVCTRTLFYNNSTAKWAVR